MSEVEGFENMEEMGKGEVEHLRQDMGSDDEITEIEDVLKNAEGKPKSSVKGVFYGKNRHGDYVWFGRLKFLGCSCVIGCFRDKEDAEYAMLFVKRVLRTIMVGIYRNYYDHIPLFTPVKMRPKYRLWVQGVTAELKKHKHIIRSRPMKIERKCIRKDYKGADKVLSDALRKKFKKCLGWRK